MTILLIAGSLTFFIGITLLLVILLSGRSAVSSRLTQVTTTAPAGTQVKTSAAEPGIPALAGISKIVMPVRRLLGLGADKDLQQRLSLAGYREPYYADLFFVAKFLAPIVTVLAAAFLIDNPFWYIAGGAVAFFAPDFWLTGAVARRREEIRLSMPDALDLLVICMEAGLGMDQALIRVGQEMRLSHPALGEELLLINLEQRAGKTRLDAWRNMAERTNLDIVRSFVTMLIQTERFGTPISKSLGHFADALRTKRRQQAEEQAAKTTIKMVFPLVLFIFPSMFIVLLAPAVIQISRVLQTVFGE